MNYKQLIKERIDNFKRDYVFIISDFYDITGYETIKSTINRLEKEGYIKRILPGLFYKPFYVELINEYSIPSPLDVAKGIARKYNWNIAPSGDTALNMLGLSNQVVVKYIFISNGRYASFKYDNFEIDFKKVNNKDINDKSYLSALIIQALKTIGKRNITKRQIEYLNKKFSESEKNLLMKECKTTSVWTYEIIRQICQEKYV